MLLSDRASASDFVRDLASAQLAMATAVIALAKDLPANEPLGKHVTKEQADAALAQACQQTGITFERARELLRLRSDRAKVASLLKRACKLLGVTDHGRRRLLEPLLDGPLWDW